MRTTIPLWLGVVLFLFMEYTLFFVKDEFVVTAVGDIGIMVLALFGAIVCLYCYFKIPKEFSDERQSWLWIALAFLFRFGGEFFWAYYELMLQIDVPTPSAADIMWHLSYIAIIIGLALKAKHAFVMHKARIVGLVLLLCAIISGIYAFMQEAFLTVGGYDEAARIAHLINYSYVIWDVFVIGLLAITLVPMLVHYNRTMRSYLVLALAFMVFTVFDVLFAKEVLLDVYVTGDRIDTFYDLGYLILIFAAHIKYTSIHENPFNGKMATETPVPSVTSAMPEITTQKTVKISTRKAKRRRAKTKGVKKRATRKKR